MSVDITDDGFTVVVDDDGVSLTVVTPGPTVPVGGTTGQVLAKASNTDYDTEWVDQTGGGGAAGDSDQIILAVQVFS